MLFPPRPPGIRTTAYRSYAKTSATGIITPGSSSTESIPGASTRTTEPYNPPEGRRCTSPPEREIGFAIGLIPGRGFADEHYGKLGLAAGGVNGLAEILWHYK